MTKDTKQSEPKPLTDYCPYCFYMLDSNYDRVRVMLPNDDSKFLSHGPCNDCAPELKAQVALYRSMQHKREITLTKSLHRQIQLNAWKRPHVAATV